MGRGRRFTSYQDYELALSKGVGIGYGENYQPWFRAQDVQSNGNRSVIFGLKTRRKHHFLSSIESDFFTLRNSMIQLLISVSSFLYSLFVSLSSSLNILVSNIL